MTLGTARPLPAETKMTTGEPRSTLAEAAGSVRTTVPLGTVGDASCCTATRNPILVRSMRASSGDFPATSGISTVSVALATKTVTVCPTVASESGAGSWRMTVPGGAVSFGSSTVTIT